MAVYNPTGSGNVHVEKVISGGKGMAKAKKGMAAAKKAAKVPTKSDANPFLKKVAKKATKSKRQRGSGGY